MFYMSLLKKNTIKKKQIDENVTELAELNVGNNSGKYKLEAICNSAAYAKEVKSSYLLKLYYLVS